MLAGLSLTDRMLQNDIYSIFSSTNYMFFNPVFPKTEGRNVCLDIVINRGIPAANKSNFQNAVQLQYQSLKKYINY